jgi:dipeptidyl aminopeptidase/acylaminoacyl peptidase
LPSVRRRSLARCLPLAGFIAVLAACAWLMPAEAQTPADPQPVKGANFKQAYKYSSEFLRQFVYSASVTPNWIGKTDTFWYEYRTSKGKQWYRVNPATASREPLFDRVKLGAQLSEQVRRPFEPLQLPLTRVSMNDDGTKLKFVTEDLQFEYDLKAEKLAKLGKAPPPGPGPGNMTPEQLQRMKEILGDERYKDFLEKQQKLDKKDKQDNDSSAEEEYADLDMYVHEAMAALGDPTVFAAEDEAQQKKKGGFGMGGFGKGGEPKVYSPDRKNYAYALNDNLYLAEDGKEKEAVQLSKDSAEHYTFAGGGFGGFGQFQKKDDEKEKEKTKDKQVRPSVTWSKDSKVFYASRNDTRNIKELFLVNSVDNPRPSLKKYPYAMPGDEAIRKTELYVYQVAKKQLIRVEPKWRDESFTDIHWGKSSDELRFVRRDRLMRNAEFCCFNTQTGACKCFFLEGFENANLETRPMKYLEESDEMIWWSERSNWGHFYLYDRAGTLKNAITSGDFRASQIVAIDNKNRIMYFKGNAREPGENVYHNHLYSVHLDGTGITLLDPGDGNHDSHLSPTRQYLVDNCSRFDAAPISVLRDHRGNKIMDLEKTDLTKLAEVGWKMPETFIVKAADGVTDLYGHLWKPFDFDPKKKYPVIAHVYPGPQTESMTHGFQPISPQQQLAQLNFIVIQVGNRGGTPLRSKNYQSHSYWNMRDYGLADKRAAIEQLAARCGFVDIDRIGIYGHSGGGFMSAAAMLVKPYNEFFKVAVASAGNHDNNVYNNSWAERYHGMKEVVAGKDDAKKEDAQGFGKKFGGFRKKGADNPPDEIDPAVDEPQAQEQKQDAGKTKDAKKEAAKQVTEEKKEAGKVKEEKKDIGKAKEEKKEAAKQVQEQKKDTGKAKEEKKDTGKEEKKDVGKAKEDKKDIGKAKEEKKDIGKAKEEKKDDTAKAKDDKKDDKAKDPTRFEIKVPTNPELAANLKGKLLLVHGDMDNNVHPANTIRLVDALIKANKRFDLIILPGKAHGFADYQPYFTERMWEYFAEHLLDDRPSSADIYDRRDRGR